ncbi:MAG: glycosyltransferase family 2 protein [Pedobacter sp.]|nr:glycosyltransferase family 2 protein [Pedobacter sp.]
MFIYYFLLVNLVIWIVLSIYLVANTRKIAFLKDQPVTDKKPGVAIVIAVRDEEDHLREALSSVCNLNYRALRVVVVNDRSTDKTGEILTELSTSYPQLHIETISSLPPGWLGKTHALYKGYGQVHEEWILFTDADVVFGPDALKKAMSYALANRLDHLTVLPQVKSRSEVLNSVVSTFQVMLEIKLRPWEARNTKSKASIGVGAFNLVRKTAYEEAGTHEKIKLRPDDDLQLAQAFKLAGLRTDVLYGEDEIELEWYHSISDFVNGLMKNTFSAFNYQFIPAMVAAFGAFVAFALPIPLGLLSGELKTILLACALLLVQLLLNLGRRGNSTRWWYSFSLTYGGALLSYITFKATFKTLKDKGIYWRGTFYSLKELRSNQ